MTDPANTRLTTSNDPQNVTVTVGTTTRATPVGFQSTGSVTGHVFSDLNGNGTQTTGEADLSGVTVTLTDSTGATRTTTTDVNGNYSFSNVPAGTASVKVTDPANTRLTTSYDPQSVTVAAGTATTASPVGFQSTGSVTGHVFSDPNLGVLGWRR